MVFIIVKYPAFTHMLHISGCFCKIMPLATQIRINKKHNYKVLLFCLLNNKSMCCCGGCETLTKSNLHKKTGIMRIIQIGLGLSKNIFPWLYEKSKSVPTEKFSLNETLKQPCHVMAKGALFIRSIRTHEEENTASELQIFCISPQGVNELFERFHQWTIQFSFKKLQLLHSHHHRWPFLPV